MINIQLTFSNDDEVTMCYPGTLKEAKAAYIGKSFNLGITTDEMEKVTEVIQLDKPSLLQRIWNTKIKY